VKIGPAITVLLESLWAMEPQRLEKLADIVLRHAEGVRLSKEEIDARIKAARDSGATTQVSAGYRVINGVAIIPVYGVIEKRASFFSDISGMCSTLAVQRDLNAALNDADVTSILLDIDSPGGSVDGVSDLADAVYEARKKKTVWAYANGLMASAAYWIGAQAEQVFAGKAATVGSIGVYTVLYDTEAMVMQQGVKVKVVKAGEMKAIGARGTAITEAQLADVQRNVNAVYDLFVTAVAIGRNLSESQARALADGRVHLGENARALGLVDGVASLDAVLGKLQTSAKTISNQSARRGLKANDGGSIMSDENKDKPADDGKSRMAALKAAFPEDLAFAVAQFEKGNDVTAAKAEYADVLQTRLKAKDEELVKAKEAQKPGGVKPLSTEKVKADEGGEQPEGSAREAFMAKVAEFQKEGLGKSDAVAKASQKYPKLHLAWLEEVNGAERVAVTAENVRKTHGKTWI